MTKDAARSPPYVAMFVWINPIPARVSTHRSARDSVTVEPRFRTAVNVSLTEPRRIESPSTSCVGESTRRSDTNVPFLLLRSSMVASLPATVRRACRRRHRAHPGTARDRVAAEDVLAIGQGGAASSPHETDLCVRPATLGAAGRASDVESRNA